MAAHVLDSCISEPLLGKPPTSIVVLALPSWGCASCLIISFLQPFSYFLSSGWHRVHPWLGKMFPASSACRLCSIHCVDVQIKPSPTMLTPATAGQFCPALSSCFLHATLAIKDGFTEPRLPCSLQLQYEYVVATRAYFLVQKTPVLCFILLMALIKKVPSTAYFQEAV